LSSQTRSRFAEIRFPESSFGDFGSSSPFSGGFGFTPGGLNDYSVPIYAGPTISMGGGIGVGHGWPGPTGNAGAWLPSVSIPAIGIGQSIIERARAQAAARADEPEPDPESIYANLPPLNPEWQDVDVFGEEESSSTFEETAPPAFIPPDLQPGSDPWEPELRPTESDEGEPPMPSFWDIASGVVDVVQGQPVGGVGFAPPQSGGIAAGTGPATTYRRDARTGALVPCHRRRRRRRLLTESDFNDLMRIATLPNKQNVTVALAKAIGRRS